MDIDLNKYHIEVSIGNMFTKDIFIKLPKTEQSLEYSLLANHVSEEDKLGYEKFDTSIKSVTGIKRVDNLIINKPTNIYYLNLYLNILKEKNMYLPSEELQVTTSLLQEKISDLIQSDNKNMTYNEMKIFLEEEKKPNESKDKTDNADKAPRFSIKTLQEKHIERKGNNGKKEKDSKN